MAARRKPYIKFQCSVCKSINYALHKSKMLKEEKKIELKKFCRKCRKRTVHKEGKK